MGFDRTLQSSPPPVVISLNEAIEAELDRLIGLHMPPRDPFNVADRCPVNPAGHQPIAACGQIVCAHCSKIFWR